MNVAEIREYKNYLTQDLYTMLRSQQRLDQQYIDDTFLVPEVKAPHSPLRSGIGYHVVSAPGEQIITSNPQVTIDVEKKTQSDSANKISREVNEVWFSHMKKANPNAFKESVKNKLARGESFLKLVHNEQWVTGRQMRHGLPVLLLQPDPMVVYASPEEDDCGWIPNTGVPNRVVIWYERQPLDVVTRYPSWSDPQGRMKKKPAERGMIEWVEYWDKDIRYFEADGESVLRGGIQPNIYKFTPFVRKMSGFGKRSPDGALEDLILSDIRMSRDLIKEECIIRSDIASIMHIFAHKPVTIRLPDNSEVDENSLRKNLTLGSYDLNLLYLPENSEIIWGDTMLPSAEAYQHLRDIRSEINQRHPFIMAGFPMGSSGRQQDMAGSAAMKRYDTVVENTEDEFSTAVSMALDICKKVPRLIPDNLSKKDLAIDYKCEVALKAKDVIEEDRLATLGSRLWQMGEIDWETNLTEYQGKTQERAQEIMNKRAVDDVITNDPIIKRLIALQTAREMGMEQQYQALEEQLGQMESNLPKTPQFGSQGGQPREGNIKTPLGREQIDMSLAQGGQRRPPQ